MSTRRYQDACHRQAVATYYQTHDETLLTPLLTDLSPRLLVLARGTFGVKQVERAEDLVQETLTWLVTQLRQQHYAGTGTVAAYAGAHLRFVFLNSRKPQPAQPSAEEDPYHALPASTATPPEVLPVTAEEERQAAQLLAAATQAVLTLDPSARACVVLTFYHGYSPAAAARQLGLADATFHTRLSRALVELQAWGQTVAAPPAEVYAALSRVDTGDLFQEPLRLTG